MTISRTDPFKIMRILFPKKCTKLDLDEYISLIKVTSKSHQLSEVLKAIYKSRKRLKIFEGKIADEVFPIIYQLSNYNNGIIERELLARNSAIYTNQNHSTEKYVWGAVSDVVFRSGASLSTELCQELIKDCLDNPINMKFALFHSDVIASIAEKHVEILNPSLIELIIEATDDSRVIYALKMANWLPRWSDVSDATLKALFSKCDPKRVEAMWLINKRGNYSEVVEFIKKCGLEAILSTAKGPNDIKWLTSAIIKFQGLSCGYVLK